MTRQIDTALLALALAGCGAQEQSLWVAPPELGAARSLIAIMWSADDALPTVEAIDLGGEPWRVRGALGDGAEITLLGYERTLASMGLASGPLRPTAGPGFRLPSPSGVHETTAGLQMVAPWRRAPTPSDRVRALRFEGERRLACHHIEPVTRALPPSADPDDSPSALVPFDDDSVLLATRRGSLSRVYADGRVAPIPRNVATSTAALRGGLRKADGTVWFASRRACLTRYVGGVLTSEGCLGGGPKADRYWLGGNPEDPEDLWVLDSDRHLFRRDAAGSELALHITGEELGNKAGILFRGAEELLVVGQLEDRVLRFGAGEIVREVIDGAILDKGVSIAEVPELGPLVGTNFGYLLTRIDGRWRTFAHTNLQGARLLSPLDESVLVAGDRLVQEVQLSGDVCPPLPLSDRDAVAWVRLGEWLFVAVSHRERGSAVDILRVRP